MNLGVAGTAPLIELSWLFTKGVITLFVGVLGTASGFVFDAGTGGGGISSGAGSR